MWLNCWWWLFGLVCNHMVFNLLYPIEWWWWSCYSHSPFFFQFHFQCAILMGKNSSVHNILFFLHRKLYLQWAIGRSRHEEKQKKRERKITKASAQGMNGISADSTQINVHYHAKNNITLQHSWPKLTHIAEKCQLFN